jgi:hypothetical protein
MEIAEVLFRHFILRGSFVVLSGRGSAADEFWVRLKFTAAGLAMMTIMYFAWKVQK